ncbi:hypothetical protein C4J81_09455 [Deltaproteobacteria bacterium Smac51]|nr:hypothetical protein C4J81_09455 [Deltaproteobacteria bacterium Smac51]
MTLQKLMDAALIRFAEQGFDATSVARLAEDVGIHKSTLYSHFKSKEDLFMKVLVRVLDEEVEYVRDFFKQSSDSLERLGAFLPDVGDRFSNTPHMRFWLRFFFLPPFSLQEQVMAAVNRHMSQMETEVRHACEKLPPSRLSKAVVCEAYLGILDWSRAELLYEGVEKFRKRLKALWSMFLISLEPPRSGKSLNDKRCSSPSRPERRT